MTDARRKFKTLRLILGDQLDRDHGWFEGVDDDVLYLLAELPQELKYVKHHVQKVCAFFAAMRRFADELADQGHEVEYLDLDKTIKYNKLEDLIKVYCDRHAIAGFEYQSPDEYRLAEQMRDLDLPQSVEIRECDSEHFLLAREELDDYVERGKHNRMETFYRKLRKRFDILMDGDSPEGGEWNYDAENRHKLKAGDLEEIPGPMTFDNDVSDILARLDRHGVETFGEARDNLPWPVDRTQARRLLAYFCRRCLANFGRFQDAMTGRHERAWSLYHSRLSFALNSKILHPRAVIDAAIERYRESDDVPLASVEGFVRQILGWREYVRAVYWVNMPDYARRNRLRARRDLPKYFWDGDTKMNCMRHALGHSLEHAYAHHIQRLMITGNFCLLAGIDPNQVDAWYLGVYVDAIEWVEMPNTRGMSQFADGGLIATKPYSAGANYINKMSDYCADCEYDHKGKTDDDACPFNSLYWHSMDRHRDWLEKNHRSGMIYRSWDRQDKAQREAVIARGDRILRQLDDL